MKAHRFFQFVALLSLGLFAASCTKEPLSTEYDDQEYVDPDMVVRVELDAFENNTIDAIPSDTKTDTGASRRLKGFSNRATVINPSSIDTDDGLKDIDHGVHAILPEGTLSKKAMYLQSVSNH